MSRKISNPEVATLESLHSAETVAFPWGLRRNPLSLIFPCLYTLTLPRDPKAMRNWCKIEYNWLGSVVEDSGSYDNRTYDNPHPVLSRGNGNSQQTQL